MYENVLHHKRGLFLSTIFKHYVQSYQGDLNAEINMLFI